MIRVENVTKDYGTTRAVDGVSFTIEPGEIVGFLGPNGAGKSTLLKMIATWLPPTSGRIEVAGHDSVRDSVAVRRSLGYLPEHNALYESMPVDRLLAFAGRARGLRGARLRERIEWVAGRCGLEPVMRKRIAHCSKGFRQRIGTAAALIHDPSVLVLDEPTHGLDPLQVVAFRDFLEELREGRAILFSSHILAEVTAISSRLLIINDGRLLADSPLAEIEERAAADGSDVESTVLEIVRATDARPGEVRR